MTLALSRCQVIWQYVEARSSASARRNVSSAEMIDSASLLEDD